MCREVHHVVLQAKQIHELDVVENHTCAHTCERKFSNIPFSRKKGNQNMVHAVSYLCCPYLSMCVRNGQEVPDIAFEKIVAAGHVEHAGEEQHHLW